MAMVTISCKPVVLDESSVPVSDDPCEAVVHLNDLYLNDAGTDIAMVDGVDAMAQIIRAAVLTYRGELQYDQDTGIPYFDTVFANQSGIDIWKSEVVSRVLDFPFVNSVESFSASVDYKRRTVSYKMTVQTTEGPLELTA